MSSLTRGGNRLVELVDIDFDYGIRRLIVGIRRLIVHHNVGRDHADVEIDVGVWWIDDRRRSITPAKIGLGPRLQTLSLVPRFAEEGLRALHPSPLVGGLILRIAGHLRPGRNQQANDRRVGLTAADVQREIEGVFPHPVVVRPHDVETWNPPY